MFFVWLQKLLYKEYLGGFGFKKSKQIFSSVLKVEIIQFQYHYIHKSQYEPNTYLTNGIFKADVKSVLSGGKNM